MHMPPPVHGAAVVGQQIRNSQMILDTFNCSYVNYSTSESLGEIGRFSFKKIISVIQFIQSIRTKIQTEKPQLVYLTPSLSGWAFYRDWLMVRMIKRQRCAVVAHFHNKPPVSFTRKWFNKLLYKSFFSGLHSIFLAECLADTFKDYTQPQLVHVCPNGMPDAMCDIPANCSNRPYTFLFLSNMMEEKGVIVLLQACALLKKRGYDYACNFIGQWSDISEQRFNSLIEELDITENVHAYGGIYGIKKASYFSSADAFVFPTYYPAECLSLVVLEAMQWALPVLTTNEGALPEVVDADCGFIVQRKDANELADIMQYLLNNPEKGIAMGLKGRKKYEREYTLPVFEQRLTNILMQVINASHPV